MSTRQKRLLQLFILALALLLALSIALNIRLLQRVQDLKLTMDTVRLDPFGTNRYAAERQAPIPPHSIVAFGDSRIEAWPAPTNLPKSWLNRGLGGETTAGASARYPVDISPLKPSAVVIELGINDLRLIPQLPQRRAEIIATCTTNLRAILDMAQHDGTQVILVTVITLGDISWKDWPYDPAPALSAIDEVNTWILQQASPTVQILDANALLADTGKIKPEYQKDGLHLNEAGYKPLNNKIITILSGP